MLNVLIGLSTIYCQMKTPQNKERVERQANIIIGYLATIYCQLSKASIDLEKYVWGKMLRF
jgi:hypothetical protein